MTAWRKLKHGEVRKPTKPEWQRLLAEIRRVSKEQGYWTAPSRQFLESLEMEIK